MRRGCNNWHAGFVFVKDSQALLFHIGKQPFPIISSRHAKAHAHDQSLPGSLVKGICLQLALCEAGQNGRAQSQQVTKGYTS